MLVGGAPPQEEHAWWQCGFVSISSRAGDSQALPGYVSVYLQLSDPRNSSKWDVFASYRLSLSGPGASAARRDALARDSWHRFSARKKSHGGL